MSDSGAGRVFIVGVGMTKFEKPGSRDWQYPDMAKEAGEKALADAGISYDLVEQAPVGYCSGPSTQGQRAVYELGLTGIPVYNVNNNCATGSSALMMARQFVQGGINDCVLALGFERMSKGALGGGSGSGDMASSPVGRHYGIMAKKYPFVAAPPAAQIFGNAAREYMERYGATQEQIALVAVKNHRHSVDNPYAQFRDEYSLEDVLAAKEIHAPLTRLQCSPTSDGAAAVVVASERFVREHGLQDKAVEIVAQTMTTDTADSFDGSVVNAVGKSMSRLAADRVFAGSGLTIDDVDVIELHDCFSINEILTYEALGMASDGEGAKLVAEGATTHGGKWVVNPSGGLISKGHPLGATGLAQATEITWHLRGEAEARQVAGAEIGLTHNIGLGGAAVVGLYRRARF
ncbi:MAG TPA: Nonspecific lipid-transfer protein [Yinghuangia sp.]|uniref:thiolase C-terminal domain-containing protein n=1 Tax=Yinghuangia sp. YIM S10712 TaxID=3436930 RepID=UPI002C377495|nr:Nonspecific lipid-transfer protein [Yinghuangia sp.]